MNKINNNLSIIVVSIVLLFLFSGAATPETAAQLKIPPGSYQQSCIYIKAEGVDLTAACATKGKVSQTLKTRLKRFYLCTGDISNQNGSLTCAQENTKQYTSAVKAFFASAPKVFGKKVQSTEEFLSWLDFMHLHPNKIMPTYYQNIMGENEAVFVLKQYLAAKDNDNQRQELIDRAFQDVYNFGAKPSDFARWNGELLKGKTGYSEIVETERQRLNTDKVIRRLTIIAAYKKAFGRPATQKEIAYWEPRAEIFKELVEASRKWLYTAKGANDLAETVARALESKTGDKPSIEQINNAISKYSKTKAIYDEM